MNSLGASQGIGPLHWAAHKEHEEIAMFLIENGADVLLKDKEERTPLSMASPELAQKMTGECIAMAALLAGVCCSPPHPLTPAVAAQRLNPALSVAPASDAHMSASEKATAACCCGNVPALQALLQSGVSLNHCSGATESTLLHMAAYCGQVGAGPVCCGQEGGGACVLWPGGGQGLYSVARRGAGPVCCGQEGAGPVFCGQEGGRACVLWPGGGGACVLWHVLAASVDADVY